VKKLSSLLILIIFSAVVYAQENTTKSKIKLTDGSELHVLIIKNVPGKYITIKLPGNDAATIDYQNIALIKHKDFSYHEKFILPRGVYFEGGTSLLFGKTTSYSARVGLAFTATVNYRFNSNISLGVGVEPTILTGFSTLPVFVRISGNVAERRVTPVYFLDTGWSFAKVNGETRGTINADGGWFLRPGIGLRINRFTISLAYQLQKVNTTSENFDWWGGNQFVVEERLMKNITAGVSLMF
jgi:hypothetical protein